MVKLSAGIDFSNLDSKREEIKNRYQSMRDFTSFFKGVLIGVLVTVPVQLLLKPLAVENGQLTYASVVLLDTVDPKAYAFAIFMTFFLILVAVPLGYKMSQGLTNWETVRLQTHGSHDKLHEQCKEILKEICEDRGLDIKAANNKIMCKDPSGNNTASNSKKILTLRFDTAVSVLHLGFAPENRHTAALLNHLEGRIEEEYDIEPEEAIADEIE